MAISYAPPARRARAATLRSSRRPLGAVFVNIRQFGACVHGPLLAALTSGPATARLPARGTTRTPVANMRMYIACMVALQIRDVSEQVRDLLAREARARGQSLQAFLLEIIEREAGYVRNVELLNQSGGRAEGRGHDPAVAVRAVHEARNERDARLGVLEPFRAHADEFE
jgi:antitoxin FitA